MSTSKSEKVRMRVDSDCVMLEGERKLLERLKNDLMRQDRENKEQFLSQFLFCGLTPAYQQSSVKIL